MSLRDIQVGGNNATIKDFVLQEAHQKSFQIGVLALKDYEKEKERIVNERKDAHLNEFEKKHKEAEAAVRIQKSALINGSRMKKMKARHNDLLKIVAESEIALKSNIIQNRTQYSNLLKKLILQGLIKMFEPIVYVRCLQRDKELIKSLLPQISSDFKNLIIQQGIDESVSNVDLRMDERFSLEQRNISSGIDDKVSKGDENTKCFGGVIMTSEDGLIVCKNTIDSRIDLAYQNMLPTIRRTLFE